MNRNYLKNSLIKFINDRLKSSQLTHDISKVFSTIYFVDIKNDVDEKWLTPQMKIIIDIISRICAESNFGLPTSILSFRSTIYEK